MNGLRGQRDGEERTGHRTELELELDAQEEPRGAPAEGYEVTELGRIRMELASLEERLEAHEARLDSIERSLRAAHDAIGP